MESKRSPASRRELAAATAIAAVVLCGLVALVLVGLDQLSYSDDEGVFVYTARALGAGERLYDRVWYNYLPGFLRLLQGAFLVGAPTIQTARLAVLSCNLVALMLLWWLVRRAFSPWAATWGVGLLALMPHFVSLSGAALADGPSALWAAIAVLAAVVSIESEHWRPYLVVAGLALAISLWFKPTTAATGVPVTLAALAAGGTARQRLARLVWLASFLVLPLFASFVLVNPAGFIGQFLPTWYGRDAFAAEASDNLRNMWEYVVDDKYGLHHLGVLALAAVGLWSLLRERLAAGLVLAAWLAGVAASLIAYSPLYRHHLVQLLLPMTALAGVGAVRVWRWLVRPGRLALRCLAGVVVALVAFEFAAGLWANLTTRQALDAEQPAVSRAAIAFLKKHSSPGDMVITDGYILALRAGLTVPPETTNTSRMRIKVGELTSAELIAIAQRDRPVAIVFWEKKLDLLDDFAAWVDCQYDLGVAYDTRYRIYLRRPDPTRGMQPLGQRFGRAVTLLGYAVGLPEDPQSAAVSLRLVWQTDGTVAPELTGFVHVLDKDGNRVAQHDGVAAQGRCPSSSWVPGESINDRHPLDLGELADGTYRVLVGIYDGSGDRLAPGLVSLGEWVVNRQQANGRRIAWQDQ
jgi:hypothetical protein